MTLAVPALVFTSLTQNTINPQFLSEMIIVVCAAYALVSIIALVFTFIFKLNLRTFLMPLISGNTGNLGLPLVFSSVWPRWLGICRNSFCIHKYCGLHIWSMGGFWHWLSEATTQRTFSACNNIRTFIHVLWMGDTQNSNECIRPNCSDGYSPNANYFRSCSRTAKNQLSL